MEAHSVIICGFWAAILNFWSLLALDNIENSLIELIDLEYIWYIADRIVQLNVVAYTGWDISISCFWSAILDFVYLFAYNNGDDVSLIANLLNFEYIQEYNHYTSCSYVYIQADV